MGVDDVEGPRLKEVSEPGHPPKVDSARRPQAVDRNTRGLYRRYQGVVPPKHVGNLVMEALAVSVGEHVDHQALRTPEPEFLYENQHPGERCGSAWRRRPYGLLHGPMVVVAAPNGGQLGTVSATLEGRADAKAGEPGGQRVSAITEPVPAQEDRLTMSDSRPVTHVLVALSPVCALVEWELN